MNMEDSITIMGLTLNKVKHFLDSKNNLWDEYYDDYCDFIVLRRVPNHTSGDKGTLLKIRKKRRVGAIKALNTKTIGGYGIDGKKHSRHPSEVKPKSSLKMTIDHLLSEGMLDNAMNLAYLNGYLLAVGQTFGGTVTAYYNASDCKSLEGCFVAKDMETKAWRVIHKKSGFALTTAKTSKKDALNDIKRFTHAWIEETVAKITQPTAKNQTELNEILFAQLFC